MLFKGYYTVILHAHEWVRREKRGEWEKFRQICRFQTNDICAFEEFKKREVGNIFVQFFSERIYLLWERSILFIGRVIVHQIRKRCFWR